MDSHCVDLRALRAILGGEIVGQQVLCPGPGHSTGDRSLAVRPTENGRFVCHSFAGDDWRECQDYVRERLGLPRWREQRQEQPVLHPLRRTLPQNDPKQNVARAKRLWDEGHDPRIPLVTDYLASRKLDLPAELCGAVLRFHPHCPWRTDDKIDFMPCLLAAFTSIIDKNTITAIHRIRLDQPERWPKTQRKMLGDIKDSAIKLDPQGRRLCVAEGFESALAARQVGFSPVWALGSARRFLPIDNINELIILGEHDDASRKATDACSELWRAHGAAVSLALPPEGKKDFNDVLLETGR
jgi:putative DNA primase/helicase